MKNLRKAIFAVLCTLIGNAAQAMDATQATSNWSLSPAYCGYVIQDYMPYTLRQEIYDASIPSSIQNYSDTIRDGVIMRNYSDVRPVGFIEYFDYRNNDGLFRYIQAFDITEAMRGQGIGTTCMKKFIEQSKAEGIATIGLTPLMARIALYERLGFKFEDPTSLRMTQELNNA